MAWGDIVKPIINPVRKIHIYRRENTGKTNDNDMNDMIDMIDMIDMGLTPSKTVNL
jgi:hypothetical protein